MDVFRNSLQASEVDQLVHGMAGFLHVIRIDDNAVALEAIADGNHLATVIIERIGVRGPFLGNGSAGEIHREIAPFLHAVDISNHEQCRRAGFSHLVVEGLVVGTGSRGDHFHRNAGSFRILRGQRLGVLVQFRFEVQPVNRSAFRESGAYHCKDHCQCKQDTENLLHSCSPSVCVIWSLETLPMPSEGILSCFILIVNP